MNFQQRLIDKLNELKIPYNDLSLYTKALTHRSYTNEHQNEECYDRLEFLGDSILDMVIGDFIFTNYPLANSGGLSKMRSALVESKALAKLSCEVLKIDSLVRYSVGEKNNVRFHSHINEDVFEAFIAAIYLDQGYVFVRKFLFDIYKPYLPLAEELSSIGDNKGKLQKALKDEANKLTYVVVNQQNLLSPNVKFTVEARLDNTVIGKGEGHNTKEAEDKAALDALNKMVGK